MKKIIMICLIMMCMLNTSCVSTYWEEDKTFIPTQYGTTNTLYSVHVGQKAFFIKSDISNLKIPYHGQTITLGKYSTIGDAASMEVISKGIVYSIAAYSSMGSVPLMDALLKAFQEGEVDRVVKKIENGEPLTVEDFPVATRYMPRKKDNK